MTEAQRSALAELGNARSVGSGLRETHLAERRYGAAAAASLILPLGILAHVLLLRDGSGGLNALVYDLLLLLPLLYVLRTLKTLLVLRYGLHVERRLMLVAAGAVALTLPEILMDGYWIALSNGFAPPPSPLGLQALDALLLVDWLGALLLGAGLIWLVEALLRIKPLRGLSGAALLAGYALALTALAALAGGGDLLTLAWLVAIGFGLVTHGLWTLLFFRAARAGGAVLAA